MASNDDASPDGGGADASAGDGETPPALDGAAADPTPGGESGETATADADSRDALPTAEQPPTPDDAPDPDADGPRVAVGEYMWAEYAGDVTTLYRGYDPRERRGDDASDRWDDSDAVEIPTPTRADWAEVGLDPESYLDFHPVDAEGAVTAAAAVAVRHHTAFEAFCDPSTTPVVKDEWLWEHYKREYYYNPDGSRPRDADGEIKRFDPADALGFDPDAIEDVLAHGAQRAEELDAVVDERTVDVDPEFDEDAFFADARGVTTVVNRYDLEKAVPIPKKTHFREVERYWVDKPHAFVIVFHSTKENEEQYYVVQPHRTPIETDLMEFLTGKLRTAIKYGDESVVGDAPGTRRRTVPSAGWRRSPDRWGCSRDRSAGGSTASSAAVRAGRWIPLSTGSPRDRSPRCWRRTLRLSPTTKWRSCCTPSAGISSVTRPSFSDDDGGDVDEFDLLEAALRQRPDYIVMGEIRGEEGRTLFQVMSTGHTTYTTFHADSVGEVLKRFTTELINVSKTMFTALDLVSIRTSTRVQGNKVRRNKSLTEINHYDAENDEFLKMGSSDILEDIKSDRGLNTYTQVATTLQAFISDEETILALMARDELERSLEDLREMESVKIDVDPEKEAMVPRPTPSEEVREICAEILADAEAELWPDYRDLDDVDVADALLDVDAGPRRRIGAGHRHHRPRARRCDSRARG